MPQQSNSNRGSNAFPRAPQSFVGRLLAFLLTALLLVVGFMFSLVALAVLAVGGTVFAGWLWWKTRALRKGIREAAPAAARRDDQVIEGEFIRETVDNDRLLR
jgi:hypothetical protein